MRMNIFVPLANAILLLEGTSVLYQASHYILPFELTVSESNPIASRYFEAITYRSIFWPLLEQKIRPARLAARVSCGSGFDIFPIILEFCTKSGKAN
jgi:hypothetical protein